jgi:hypothetical protein
VNKKRLSTILGAAGLLLVFGLSALSFAQDGMSITSGGLPLGNPLLHDQMIPGEIGAIQLRRQPCLQGYFQPVEVRGPRGTQFALVSDGYFTNNVRSPLRAAMLVGNVYRFRMSHIEGAGEVELFPSIEIIDRTYPPAERSHRFPIVIEIDEVDIEAAMTGDLVTRVIYLEDSTNAEPDSYADGIQRVLDVSIAEDTLRTADYYGRPVAILRIGSRVPEQVEGPEALPFLFGSPPWLPIKATPQGKTLSDATPSE